MHVSLLNIWILFISIQFAWITSWDLFISLLSAHKVSLKEHFGNATYDKWHINSLHEC